jgi:hypothetical protein
MAGSDNSQPSDPGGIEDQDDFAKLERLLREAPKPENGKQSFDEWIGERAHEETDKKTDEEAGGAKSSD